jgi:hypothetical protein
MVIGEKEQLIGDKPLSDLRQCADVRLRELSLKRDLFATAKLCEILGLCSFGDAAGFEASFRALADLGYAGYCYYDFASVSIQGLFDVYQELLRQHIGDPQFHAIHVWMWTGRFLNARSADDRGKVRIVLKNVNEPDATGVFFGRSLRCDRKFGVEEGQTTKVELIERFARDLERMCPGMTGFGLPDKDIAILRIMDLLNEMYPNPGDEELLQRVPFNHAFTDIGAGRWVDGNRYGHIFVYPDGAMGVEGVQGFENTRHLIALGAQLEKASRSSS